MPATDANPRGYWESSRLTRFNDDLLGRLGGSWAAPPALPEGWWRGASVASLQEPSRALFRSVQAEGPFVWKDPRNCLTLPFWRDALGFSPPVLLVTRDPVEVALSLRLRDALPKLLSLALWERYVRESLRACRGLPVLVLRFENVMRDPVRTCERVRSFLAKQAIPCRELPDDRIREFLDPTIPRSSLSRDGSRDPDLSPAQCDLLRVLETIEGEHAGFAPPDLPPETRWCNALFEQQRGVEYRRRELGALIEARGRTGEAIGRLEAALGRVEREVADLRRQVGALRTGRGVLDALRSAARRLGTFLSSPK